MTNRGFFKYVCNFHSNGILKAEFTIYNGDVVVVLVYEKLLDVNWALKPLYDLNTFFRRHLTHGRSKQI